MKMPRHGILFGLTWFVALVGAIFLLFHFQSRSQKLVGMVEAVIHPICPLEGGRIAKLYYSVGDKVEAGQIVAELDNSDLDIELVHLRADLENAKAQVEAERVSVRTDTLRQKLDHERQLARARDLANEICVAQAEAQSRIATQSKGLKVLRAECVRQKSAVAVGMGDPAALAEIQYRLDSSLALIEGGNQILHFLDLRERDAVAELRALKEIDLENLVRGETTTLLARIDRAQELSRRIALAEEHKRRRSLVAPCNALVIQVQRRVGDTVADLGTVLSLQENEAHALDAWLPEETSFKAQLGQSVQIMEIGTSNVLAEGSVSFLYPGFAPLPTGLLSSLEVIQGRRIRIELSAPYCLLPGQRVEVLLLENSTKL